MTIPLFDSRDIVVDDRDTWCTPQEIVDALLRLWPNGADLDPCANDRSIVPCRRRYTLADCVEPEDQHWEWNERVYCNPPFSNTAPWAARMAGHDGAVVGCVLCDPSVSWWREVWSADLICFPDHRVRFIPPPSRARLTSFNLPIALPFWLSWEADNDDAEHWRTAFHRAFGELGKVIDT